MLRNLGFAVAVILGGVGIWLIVTGGNSTQRIEIGVLTGLWGLLLGAIFGRRLVVAEATPTPEPSASTEVAVPDRGEVESAATADAQRAFASELQEMLRREFAAAVDDALTREVSELRAEIAELRQELLDKVGGQLRLERIETTRLIGSDLEAMRAEVRRLKQANAGDVIDAELDLEDEPHVVDAGPETARIPKISEPIAAEPPTPPAPPAPTPPAAQPTPEPAPVPTESTAPAGADPFAGLPRLSRFTDFPLDPADTPAEYGQPRPDEEAAEPSAGARAPRHRRRRSDDPAGEELLAQLLAREGARR